MITVRRDDEISDVEGDWFRARWHFSFDSYRDPAWMQWGTLRVFNDDRLIPGAVWPLHPHRDIEGLTYVVEGTFAHEDNVGGPEGMLPAGSVQRMTLGSGAWHSEKNGSAAEPMRFIQMWIMPEQVGLQPGVEQRVFTETDRTDRLLEAMSRSGGDAVKIHQDASVFVGRLHPGATVKHDFEADQGAYLYVIEGALRLGDEVLRTGDAARIGGEERIALQAEETTELIMVQVRLRDVDLALVRGGDPALD
ncbi:MAG: pirin family protein [Actinomycetota bacterium]